MTEWRDKLTSENYQAYTLVFLSYPLRYAYPLGQFHHHFWRAFFVQFFCQSKNITRKSCQNDVHIKNSYVKTLMKLTTGWEPLVYLVDTKMHRHYLQYFRRNASYRIVRGLKEANSSNNTICSSKISQLERNSQNVQRNLN